MSALDRRTLLKVGAAGGLAVATPAAAAMGQATVILYDSRIPEALAFARTTAHSGAIDLYREHHTHFADLRSGAHPRRIEGLTRWSDWVAIRGELEAQGFRLVSEAPVAAPASGRGHLFRWSMRRR